MRVKFKTGSPVTPERLGDAVAFVHVPTLPSFDADPNLWAIVIDETTGTFCAVRLFDMNAKVDPK